MAEEFDMEEDLSDVGMEYIVTPAASAVKQEAVEVKSEPSGVKQDGEETGGAGVKREREDVPAAVASAKQPKEEEQEDDERDDEAEYLGTVTCVCHQLTNYTFGKGRHASAKSVRTLRERMIDRKRRYETDGCRLTVAAVLLAHVDGVAHVLLLRKRDEKQRECFGLPQTRIRTGEEATKSLSRSLNKNVSKEQSWTVLAQIGKFVRPEFNAAIYPYELPHVSHPKEVMSLFLVQMERFTAFTVGQSAVVVAVPLTQLYKADSKYGDVIAALPLFLSRFAFVFA